jgi:hypothetical protein
MTKSAALASTALAIALLATMYVWEFMTTPGQYVPDWVLDRLTEPVEAAKLDSFEAIDLGDSTFSGDRPLSTRRVRA